MELLVVTLAQVKGEKDLDTADRLRLMSETMRNAPGLVNVQSYQGRGQENYYLLLSTWDDEESWRKAQERHHPRQVLLNALTEAQVRQNEQWFTHYLWGYRRPAITSNLAMLHLMTLRPERVDQMQSLWLKSLRQQAAETSLAYAFLGRGVREDAITTHKLPPVSTGRSNEPSYLHGSILLTFLTWSSQSELEAFYSYPGYQQMNAFISGSGLTRNFSLERC